MSDPPRDKGGHAAYPLAPALDGAEAEAGLGLGAALFEADAPSRVGDSELSGTAAMPSDGGLALKLPLGGIGGGPPIPGVPARAVSGCGGGRRPKCWWCRGGLGAATGAAAAAGCEGAGAVSGRCEEA